MEQTFEQKTKKQHIGKYVLVVVLVLAVVGGLGALAQFLGIGTQAIPPEVANPIPVSGITRTFSEDPFIIEYGREEKNIPGKRQPASFWKKTGATWVKFNDMSWSVVEPFKPGADGKDHFFFTDLDTSVREWDDQDFNIFMVLRSLNTWGIRDQIPFCDHGAIQFNLGAPSRMPLPENEQSYKNFIAAVVDRYNGDGKNDITPALKHPIKVYEIESEAAGDRANLFFQGTSTDYKHLLDMATSAARSVDPTVKIILNGTNLRDFYATNRTDAQVDADIAAMPEQNCVDPQAMINWVLDTFSATTNYDIVENHENAGWRQIYGNAPRLRKELTARGGQDKDLWVGDGTQGPIADYAEGIDVHPAFGKDTTFYNNLLNGLKNRDTTYYPWYHRVTAQDVIKKNVAALDAGYTHVTTGLLMNNWPDFTTFPHVGFVDDNGTTTDLTDDKPFPSFYSYALMTQKLAGLKTLRRLNFNNDRIFAYEAVSNVGVKTYVLWYDDGTYQLPGQTEPSIVVPFLTDAAQVFVTTAITEMNKDTADTQTLTASGGKVDITLGKTPLFIEILPPSGAPCQIAANPIAVAPCNKEKKPVV